MNRYRQSFNLKVVKQLKNSLSTKETQQLKKCCAVPVVEELGQPTYWTHPHLFRTSTTLELNKQVTPGLTREEFAQRRLNYATCLLNFQRIYFSSKITNKEKSSFVETPFKLLNLSFSTSFSQSDNDQNFIAVIPSAMNTHMSPDVPNKFKQNSDFLYLSGFKEPNSVLVIYKTNSTGSTFKSALFVREKNPHVEVWEGPCTGSSNINRLCGDDLQAFSVSTCLLIWV